MREVQQWIARRRSTGNSQGAEEWVARVEKAAAKSLRGKRVLVFVNPECGAKQAKQHSEDIVRPMLAALGCLSVEFSETDAKNSAMELLHTADVSELDAVLVLGGSGTVNEVVRGLYYASQARADEPQLLSMSGAAAQKSSPEPLSMPIGIIPEGSENALYATISGYGDQVHADEEEAVRAMLRLVRMRRAPLPLLLCQADDGVVMPVLSNGLRFGTEEGVARNGKRLPWLRLPNLARKFSEMWSVFRAHKFQYTVSYLPASAKGEPAPSFDNWVETEAWQTVEGDFVGIGVLPQVVVNGCAPPPIGTAAARAAARAAASGGGGGAGAWLTWIFDSGDTTRSELEELQHTYSAAAVGEQAAANENSDADDSHPALWSSEQVAAFSIECREDTEWKRRWSVDGETPGTHPGPVRVRGRVHPISAMLLV